jgi:hypothetical protein
MNDILPPPMTFKSYLKQRRELAHSKPTSLKSDVVVSLSKPHKILSVSEEIAETLGFAPDAMHGRSIQVFQGPRSDTSFLDTAIRESRFRACQQFVFTFYSSNGMEFQARTRCTPVFEKNGKLYGCALDIDTSGLQAGPTNCHASRESNVSIDEPRQLLRSKFESRALYNFRMGLSIHQAFVRQRQECSYSCIEQDEISLKQFFEDALHGEEKISS